VGGGGFTVWLANFEWQIQFLKIPPNLIARSEHVYKLSPDVTIHFSQWKTTT
jgi:hypothetical protein